MAQDKAGKVDRAGRIMYDSEGKLIPIKDRVAVIADLLTPPEEAKILTAAEFAAADTAAKIEARKARARRKKVGHYVRHSTRTNGIVLVPIPTLPLGVAAGGSFDPICPTCQIFHGVKTLHIWVGPTGEATVSEGVLELMKGAGMGGFTQETSTNKPPALQVGQGKTPSRMAQDNANRSMVIYSPQATIH